MAYIFNSGAAPHTPGPWKVRAGTFAEDGVPSYEVVMPGEPNLNAVDARLIAAAPDLYDALRWFVRWYNNCDCGTDEHPASERPCGYCRGKNAIALADRIPTVSPDWPTEILP